MRLWRRVIHAGVLLAAISILWFALLAASPGDYFDAQKFNERVSPATLDKLRADYGLTQPLPVRYGRWVWSIVRGDMGLSIVYNQPVGELLAPRIANTLLLTTSGMAMAWLIALPLGLWAGARARSLADRVLGAAAGLLMALPELLLGALFVYLAARSGKWPAGGMRVRGGWLDVAKHLVLPAVVLAAGWIPVIFQHARAAAVEALAQPFVRSARALGISAVRIWLRYLLPALANPLISLLGLTVAGLLSSSLIVEVVFGWPGLGPMFVEAVLAKDTYLILTPVMLSAAALVLSNLLADLLLAWNDPRIRMGKL